MKTKKQLLPFLNHLSTILSTSIPLQRGLSLLENIYSTQLIKNINEKIKEGLSLADVFSQYKINPLFINLLKIGEQNGILVECINAIITISITSQQLTKKIIKSCIYPAIVIIVS
ncbi:type II secretion system F family protein, partial [Candidatus Margulisiibacteriota bacterium]